MFAIFVNLSQIRIGFFTIQTAAFFMQSAEQSDGIRFLRFRQFFRLFQRAANDFGLGNLPACGKPLETMGRRFVQSECRAVRHGSHTIIRTITVPNVKAGRRKG